MQPRATKHGLAGYDGGCRTAHPDNAHVSCLLVCGVPVQTYIAVAADNVFVGCCLRASLASCSGILHCLLTSLMPGILGSFFSSRAPACTFALNNAPSDPLPQSAVLVFHTTPSRSHTSPPPAATYTCTSRESGRPGSTSAKSWQHVSSFGVHTKCAKCMHDARPSRGKLLGLACLCANQRHACRETSSARLRSRWRQTASGRRPAGAHSSCPGGCWPRARRRAAAESSDPVCVQAAQCMLPTAHAQLSTVPVHCHARCWTLPEESPPLRRRVVRPLLYLVLPALRRLPGKHIRVLSEMLPMHQAGAAMAGTCAHQSACACACDSGARWMSDINSTHA